MESKDKKMTELMEGIANGNPSPYVMTSFQYSPNSFRRERVR